jgi:DNA-binding response OmpR family regulator
MRILLVEDSPEVRTLLADVLREAGHDVVEAYDLKTAVQGLSSAPSCEAVVTDAMLPGGSVGLQIATMAKHVGVPVLVCTGHPDAMMVLQAQGVAYLQKPFDTDALLMWIEGSGRLR